jgi:NADH-quinone oxidoreductase subunit C
MDLKELIIQKLKENFPEVQFDINNYREQLSLSFDKTYIVQVSKFLKEDPDLQFKLCEDVTAIDWATLPVGRQERKDRFTVVYHIFSLMNKFRLRLKVNVDESECNVDSVSSIWKTANWHERETYDMYGISFNNHPDLRRMYMPEEFEYHPLRKDFPLMGIPGSLPLPKKEE